MTLSFNKLIILSILPRPLKGFRNEKCKFLHNHFSQSSDLNLVEHAWKHLGSQINLVHKVKKNFEAELEL